MSAPKLYFTAGTGILQLQLAGVLSNAIWSGQSGPRPATWAATAGGTPAWTAGGGPSNPTWSKP